jgi:RNA polymerase sigma-70 factor (ECF subfamily)
MTPPIGYDSTVPPSDLNDIQLSLQGDQHAFRRLVDRHEPDIARMMWRFSRRPEICEELIQEVFVQAYLSLKGYRGDAPFIHWLRRIATRVGYRFWKTRARKRNLAPLEHVGPLADPDSVSDPAEAGQAVHELLERLDPPDRLVLTLQYFDQCSVKDIADRMGWSEGKVKMRAHRARKQLKEIARREKLFEDMG